jgi:hypothetical protein
MKSDLETKVTNRLDEIGNHLHLFAAAYTALCMILLYLSITENKVSPCMRYGRGWAPTRAAARADQHFGFDHRCLAKQMFGMEEAASSEALKPVIAQGMIAWFLGLVFLMGVLVLAIASGISTRFRLMQSQPAAGLVRVGKDADAQADQIPGEVAD